MIYHAQAVELTSGVAPDSRALERSNEGFPSVLEGSTITVVNVQYLAKASSSAGERGDGK